MEKIKAFWASLPIRKKLLLAVAVLILIGIATQGKAQQNCGPIENVFAKLSQKFGEQPISQGQTPQALFQFWANPETRSWTIVAVLPDGSACLMAAGLDYETIAPKPNV